MEKKPREGRSAPFAGGLPTSERILLRIKTRGPQGAADLGEAVGITGEAARQQLVRLESEGLVVSSTQPGGVGRPARIWALSDAGHARFPNAHADLTVQLVRSVRTVLGAEALERLVSAREEEMLAHYGAALEGAKTTAERLERLTALRSKEGYMAEWLEDNGGYVFVENHCPICAAASACQGFCDSELDLFRRLLGQGTSVTRLETATEGARRCLYRIEPGAGPGRPDDPAPAG